MTDEDMSVFSTPTPLAGTGAEAFDHEAFLNMLAVNQLVEAAGGSELPPSGNHPQADPLQSVHDIPPLAGWRAEDPMPAEQIAATTTHDAEVRPARKRQRREDEDMKGDEDYDDNTGPWSLDPPPAPRLAPTQIVGDSPSPYDASAKAPTTEANTHSEPAAAYPVDDDMYLLAADAYQGKLFAHPTATPSKARPHGSGKGKERATQETDIWENDGDKVLVSVAELGHLRELARQQEEERSSWTTQGGGTGRAQPQANAQPHHHPVPAAIARPIDIRDALRPPNSRQPSPTNAFPITVDLNDPEQRKLFRELLQNREVLMPWARRSRADIPAPMDVDMPNEPEPGEWTDDPHSPPPSPPPPRLLAQSSRENPDVYRPLIPTSHAETMTSAAANAEWMNTVKALGLSQLPNGGLGKFPKVHTRSPADRMRGIPQEARDEFMRLPRGTRMILEVYGKAIVDRAEATRITRDIEHVVRTVTKLDVFCLTPPPRPAQGTPLSEAPTAWLLTGITPWATKILANRHGWATRDVAFFAYDQPEPLPTYLFTLEGFNQGNADMAATIVCEEFKREPTFNAIKSYVAANSELNTSGNAKQATHELINTVRVVLRYTDNDDENSAALGHVYMDSPTLSPEQWTIWRDGIIEKRFSLSFYAYDLHGEKIRCDRCHGADHMTNQCDYMHLGDWHGTYTPYTPPPPPPRAQQVPAGGPETYAMGGDRGTARGKFRGYGGAPRRGTDMRARGGKRFSNMGVPRGG
ncbi:hypothetical protein OH77DRAFT_1435735 [Trametes cingulata]|nr:hypothetical protein OH77DRAFT_1435735 [Trametes cingulata]